MRNLSTRLLGAALAVSLLASGATAMGNGNKKVDVQNCLVRLEANLDGKAKGSVRIRRMTKKGDVSSRFDVIAQRLDKDGDYDLYIEDGVDVGTFTKVADLAKKGGTFRYSVDTKKGDNLPFDVDELDDLTGRDVEVRSGEDVVLNAVVPGTSAEKKPVKLKVKLDVPEDSPTPDAKGTLDARVKADKGQRRFILNLKKVFVDSGELRVWIETEKNSDVFEDAGAVSRKGKSKNGIYRRDCKQGAPLPLGVDTLDELDGRIVQVRNESEKVLIEGTFK